MYVHVIGWETAKKDKIDLEGSKLKEKQGLYTCPPSSPNQLPFHCCLEVKEEQIKVLCHSPPDTDGIVVRDSRTAYVQHAVLKHAVSTSLFNAEHLWNYCYLAAATAQGKHLPSQEDLQTLPAYEGPSLSF